jgi:menaquinone-dependent protoporphyrinogen oxidase
MHPLTAVRREDIREHIKSARSENLLPRRWEDALNVLIVYGTTEGQTQKIAEWTATRIRERGHQAELLDSAALESDLDLETYDAFIIAESVHQECHQEALTDFVFAHHEMLDAKPSAFVSVSLSAVLEGAEMEAQKYVDDFVSVTKWRPRRALLLGGALLFSEYDYFQSRSSNSSS